jgi:hypothetical protein
MPSAEPICKTKDSSRSSVIKSDYFESGEKTSHVYEKETICEVHRRIYDLCVLRLQDRPELLKSIITDLETAYKMGLSLCRKLVEYKCDLPEWRDRRDHKAEALRILRRQLVKATENRLKCAVVFNKEDRKLLPSAYSWTYRDMFWALGERFDTRSVTKPCSAKDIEADVIIFFDVHSSHHIKIDGIENHNAVKYEYFNDPHQEDFEGYYQDNSYVKKLGAEKRCRRAKERGVRYIICPYKNGYHQYIEPYAGDMEFIWFPVAPRARNTMRPPLAKRKPLVLCNGHLWRGVDEFRPYEFRGWASRQPSVCSLPHWTLDKEIPSGNTYQTFLCLFAGALALCDTYVVPKYLEIPLTKTLCFAQYQPEYEDMGFKDGESCIYVTKENFNETIEAFKANPAEYQPIADKGYETALNWTAEKFAEHIYQHAKERI